VFWSKQVPSCGDGSAGFLLKSLGKQRWQLIVYIMMLTASTGAMAATTPMTESLALGPVFYAAIGVGLIGNAALSLTPFCLDPADIGIALALVGSSRAVFSAIGQANFSAILANKLTVNIPKYDMPAATGAGLPAADLPAVIAGLGTGNFTGVPGVTSGFIAAARAAYVEAYSQSFKVVYLSTIAFSACALIAALFVPDLDEAFYRVRLLGSCMGRESNRRTLRFVDTSCERRK
jgi:hypothetical protein